ncbi:MAG: hypothetical protein JXB88_12395 [Spirochaetales bacterium]|nr:hypothetical protein [Spirochaetales bacterium]
MGIHDRDYMRVDRPGRKSSGEISLWKRFRFWLHLLFRRKMNDTKQEISGEKGQKS